MLTRPSFKKSLIVEQFQGNYLNTQNRRAKRNTNKTGKNEEKIKKLTRFVWRLRRLKQNDNGNKKTMAEEAIQNNRNNARKNGHENMKCYVTENNWRT